TLAVMSGFHIAVDEGTEISLYDQIFVDIGDGQSVENALSTFSSHVKNLADILRLCGKSTLLLFDEIGSGTEPNEGAALAIAMLEAFYGRGCITVATTHYGEIKNYSSAHPDFENAAMRFEPNTLDPLYELQIGESGESNALYISRKMGIPDQIIAITERYIATKSYNYPIVDESKKRTQLMKVDEQETTFGVGDRVCWLETNEIGIVAEVQRGDGRVKVLLNDTYESIVPRRLRLEIPACDLYPEGYDLTQLFVSFEERKFEHDMARGSKKALRKIQKEMRRS
ncbi:MAG: MutS-related protein, partial [Bacilli bacterium]